MVGITMEPSSGVMGAIQRNICAAWRQLDNPGVQELKCDSHTQHCNIQIRCLVVVPRIYYHCCCAWCPLEFPGAGVGDRSFGELDLDVALEKLHNGLQLQPWCCVLQLLCLAHLQSTSYSIYFQVLRYLCRCTLVFSECVKVTFQSLELTVQIWVYEWLCRCMHNMV